MTVDQLYNLLRNNVPYFFSVEFERRTNRRDGTAVQGDSRRMLCRTGVHSYKRGIIPDAVRDADDFRHAVLTVWSMDSYMRLRRAGDPDAPWNAWRRIDLTTVRSCSVVPANQLPPDIVAGLHQIQNAYRLANLPRQPI